MECALVSLNWRMSLSDLPSPVRWQRAVAPERSPSCPSINCRTALKPRRFRRGAVTALGAVPCGYKIGATSVEVQRLLSCREPIYSPILSEDVLPSRSTFRMPAGLLGVEYEFGFVMDRDFPASAEATEHRRVAGGRCGMLCRPRTRGPPPGRCAS